MAIVMWQNAGDLKAQLKDVMQRASGNNGALLLFWDSIIAGANTASYWDVINGLAQRGYSQGLAQQWDRGYEFQRAIGLWWCLTTGLSQTSESYDSEALKEYMLDRRPELLTVLFTVGGIYKPPDLEFGQANTGPLDTSQDLFVMDPNDNRIGIPTRL